MIYDPQVYAIEDRAMVPFISEKEIDEIVPNREKGLQSWLILLNSNPANIIFKIGDFKPIAFRTYDL